MSLFTFSDSLVKSAYINIINYSGSKLAILNNTMQTKQRVMKETALIYIQIETRFTRDYILGWKDFKQECSKSSIFINSICWNCTHYIFISRGAAFFYALGIFETGFKYSEISTLIKRLYFYVDTTPIFQSVEANSELLSPLNFQIGPNSTSFQRELNVVQHKNTCWF